MYIGKSNIFPPKFRSKSGKQDHNQSENIGYLIIQSIVKKK